MKERPLIFTGESVRAILAGTKTQTRRLLKLAPTERAISCIVPAVGSDGSLWDAEGDDDKGLVWHSLACPYGVPGDRLWVRETWCPEYESRGSYLYRADPSSDGAIFPDGGHWHPSIFMPRRASRITLEVTEVRVQRVQEISEEDAKAEGCEATGPVKMWGGFERMADGTRAGVHGGADPNGPPPEWMEHPELEEVIPARSARYCFEMRWWSINGKRALWSSNPWVWVLSFRRVQ